MTGKVAIALRVMVLLLLACTGAGGSHAQSVMVAPQLGEWEYSHIRCGTRVNGFTNEAAAESDGVQRYYNHSCGDATLFSPGNWGTSAEPQRGACGSTNWYPRFKMGMERLNTRHPKVLYCERARDSFTLYRERTVSCPKGFKAVGNLCAPIDDERQPQKNAGPECPSNGSNPINGATGNKYQREEDLAVTPSGLGLTRYYNSYRVLPASLTEPGLPANWRHSFSRAISWRAGSVSTATIARPDGRAWNFTLDQSGVWQSDTDVPGTLTQQSENGAVLGWTYQNKNNEVEHYNADGKLQSIASPEGLDLTLAYQAERLAAVADRYGHQLQFHYYPEEHAQAGLLAEVIGPDGSSWQYSYDEHDNLISVQYPDLSGQLALRQYHYNEPAYSEAVDSAHVLTGITLETGQRYGTYRYDTAGRAVSSEHGSMQANHTQINYHADGSRTITDALGTSRDYHYENHLGVAKVTAISAPCSQCGGQNEQRLYDSAGRVISQTDFRGNETQYRYEDLHWPDLASVRSEAVGTAQQRTTSTKWNALWRLPAERAEPQLFTRWHYQGDSGVDCGGAPGALCRLEQWSTNDVDGAQGFAVDRNGSPRVTRWQYVPANSDSAAAGMLLSVDGPRDDVSDVEHYEYDHDSGYLTATINGLGHRTRYEQHDSWGRPARIIDANGLVTEQHYHPRGWLLQRVVGGAVTTLSYDEAGQLIAVTNPENESFYFDYDDAKRLVALRDGDGNKVRYVLSALGDRQQELIEDAQGNVLSSLSRQFDQLNRVKALIDGEGGITQYDYDAAGNLIRQQSPQERVTEYQYDPMNRLTRIIDALQGETEFNHDGADRISLVRDANLAETSYQYDGFGNLLSQLSPDTGETLHQYDPVGNRLRSTDARGVTVIYQYDALNRLVQLQYPDSTHDALLVHDLGANGIGRLGAIEEHDQALRFSYDERGNLTSQRFDIAGREFAVDYQHDQANRIVSLSYPSGAQVFYQRDGQGQVAEVSAQLANGDMVSVATNMRYRAFGGLLQLVHGNGIVLNRDYDLAGRLIQHSELPVLDLHFSYDADGNLLSRNQPSSSAQTEHYQYDDLNRLIAANGGFGSQSYDYDAVGNRLQLLSQDAIGGGAESSATYIYQSASNRLLRAAGQDYQYDAAGNPLQIGEMEHDYDERGRLQTISRNGQMIARYHYNLFGQRTSKVVAGNGAATAEWHRAQAAAAQVEAATITAQLQALDIEYAAEQATRQAALNLAAQHQLDAQQSQQHATTLEQQAEQKLVLAEQSRIAAAEQQRLSDQALASRSDSWLGWLFNWWYELRSSNYLAEADRLTAQAADYEAESNLLQQQAATERQQADQHLADADAQTQLAQVSLNTLADIDNARQQKQVALSEAIALSDYHLAQAEQPQVEDEVRRFIYNKSGQMIGEYHEDGTPIREYIYRDMTPMMMLDYQQNAEQPEAYWYHTDQLGTPQALTDQQGNIVWQARYSPFGEAEILVSSVEQPLRFPGQYYDQESGYHQNWFRDYAPAVGRYIQSDPIGLSGGVNSYAYVGGDPLAYIDPWGLAYGLGGGAYSQANAARRASGEPGFFGGVCGEQGSALSVMLIPDGPFRDACRKHDACYSDCGKSKEQCDLEMCTNGACFYGFMIDSVFKRASEDAFKDAQRESGCDNECN